MRSVRWLILALGFLGPSAGFAQDQVATGQNQILVINLDQLFAESQLGQATKASLDSLQAEAQTENNRLVAELIAEEQDLARRRPDMTIADFRIEADAFDAKAQSIRAERDAKDRELTQARTDATTVFREQVRSIVREVMIAQGGSVVLDSRSVYEVVSAADITALVIEKLDEFYAAQLADQ